MANRTQKTCVDSDAWQVARVSTLAGKILLIFVLSKSQKFANTSLHLIIVFCNLVLCCVPMLHLCCGMSRNTILWLSTRMCLRIFFKILLIHSCWDLIVSSCTLMFSIFFCRVNTFFFMLCLSMIVILSFISTTLSRFLLLVDAMSSLQLLSLLASAKYTLSLLHCSAKSFVY